MKKLIIPVIILAVFIFSSCGAGVLNLQDPLNPFPQDENLITAHVLLTDKPVSDIDGLTVTIDSVSYVYSSDPGEGNGTVTEPVELNLTVDLLSLANTEINFFEIAVPENEVLVQIRFKVSDAFVTIAGTDYQIEISGDQDIVKIPFNSFIYSGDEIVLDFDVLNSLHAKGSGNSQGQESYILSPVLHSAIYRESQNYARITGKIFEAGSPVFGAVAAIFEQGGSNPIRTTVTRDCPEDINDGYFSLGRVSEGNYTVKIYKIIDITSDNPDYTNPDYTQDIEVQTEDVYLEINL